MAVRWVASKRFVSSGATYRRGWLAADRTLRDAALLTTLRPAGLAQDAVPACQPHRAWLREADDAWFRVENDARRIFLAHPEREALCWVKEQNLTAALDLHTDDRRLR
jgi:hypothetical protein